MDSSLQNLVIPSAILLIAILGYISGHVDLSGGISGIIIALIIWFGVGMIGMVSLFLFFAFGSSATSWKKEVKSKLLVSQENKGKRTVSNVLGNVGVAGIISTVAIVSEEYTSVLTLMLVASFATACSDTLSSELGNVYGKRYYQVLSWKPAQQGLDGVISIPGLLFGLIGSLLIAGSIFFFSYPLEMAMVVMISGMLGNITDSILGASLQQKGYLNNHLVNFFATFAGAAFALIFIMLLSQ